MGVHRVGVAEAKWVCTESGGKGQMGVHRVGWQRPNGDAQNGGGRGQMGVHRVGWQNWIRKCHHKKCSETTRGLYKLGMPSSARWVLERILDRETGLGDGKRQQEGGGLYVHTSQYVF
ncbi:hypothetical protein B0H11DRAFT_1914882 [Mycena galericulata]|nr:hypothetical protein B0H11DRAFT_1914882 [Mycena galericulata]